MTSGADLFQPGMRLGKYTLVAPIGKGGMGGVWEIADAEDRRYALKSPAAIFRSSTGTAFSQGRTSRGRIGENGRVSIGVAFPVVRR